MRAFFAIEAVKGAVRQSPKTARVSFMNRLILLALVSVLVSAGCARNFQDPKRRIIAGTAYTLDGYDTQVGAGVFSAQLDQTGVFAEVRQSVTRPSASSPSSEIFCASTWIRRPPRPSRSRRAKARWCAILRPKAATERDTQYQNPPDKEI